MSRFYAILPRLQYRTWRRYMSTQVIPALNQIPKPKNNVKSTEECISLIKEYNLRHTLSTDKWDEAFTNLLTNLNDLNLPSISSVLKQCGIFIYRLKKEEKYETLPNPNSRQRLLDALVNSIIARISKSVDKIDDENAEHFLEILQFFSKNYYSAAYRIYESLDYNFKLGINDWQLRIKFIYALTTFSRVYGMVSSSYYHNDAIKILISYKNLNLQNASLLLDVLSPNYKIPQERADKILDIMLSLLNYSEFNMRYHMLTHRDLTLLINNLPKLYKYHPSKKQFKLQIRLLKLLNLAYGHDNYVAMSPLNIIKITESLHKIFVIALIHDEDDIVEQCSEGFLKIVEAMCSKISSIGVSPLTRMISVLSNVNYLAKCISPEFNDKFKNLLEKVANAVEDDEFKDINIYSLIIIINILKSKTTSFIANKLLETLNKTNLNQLSLKEINSTISCLLHLKHYGILDTSDTTTRILNHSKLHDLEIDIAIDLHSNNFITTENLLEISQSKLDMINGGQLRRLSQYITTLQVDHPIITTINSKTENKIEEYQLNTNKIRAIRSARRLGLPIEINPESNSD